MVVGNGESVKGAADQIDRADLVIRFNDCRSAGIGGTRTDIVAVCNTGRPGKAMIESASWKSNVHVRAAQSIWCTRNPQKFAEMKPHLAISHPELDDFCDDYTYGFARFCEENGKHLHVFPASTHTLLDQELSALGANDFVIASTGLLAIAELLWHHSEPADHVVVTGFGHSGWEWHPWAAERAWIEKKIAAGRLSRADALSPPIPPSSRPPAFR